jgi:hypothetical protein
VITSVEPGSFRLNDGTGGLSVEFPSDSMALGTRTYEVSAAACALRITGIISDLKNSM